MPFNGAGMFVRLRSWAADAAAGIKIRADYHDLEDDGFADGISHCIARDGQSVITQNIPMNGKRITSMADPIDQQDAANKNYTDTKLSLTGGTLTGDLTINKISPSLTLNGIPGGENKIVSQKNALNRWVMHLGNALAESGSNAGSDFQLASCNDSGTVLNNALMGTRSTGLLTVTGNPTNVLGIAPKQYVDTTVNAMGALKLSLTGGTITGGLTVNGELVAVTNYLRFGYSGSPGYIIWNGGSSYSLGGGGVIWHSGNLGTPISNGRWVHAGDQNLSADVGLYEPYNGSAMTGIALTGAARGVSTVRWRYMQLLAPAGWFTVAY